MSKTSLTYDRAAAALASVIRQADAKVYALRQREHTMMPRQFKRELAEARQQGMAAVKTARAELTAAVARERQQNLRTLRPTAEQAALVTMYATQGMALAQAGMRDLECGIRDQLAAGNQQAAREYLRAGGSRLQDHMRQTSDVTEYRKLERAAANRTEAKRAAIIAGLDVYAEQTGRLDGHLRDLESRLGDGDLDPEPGHARQDLGRVVDLWHSTAEDTATEAGLATAESFDSAAAECGVTDA